jgi:hypothetical protein
MWLGHRRNKSTRAIWCLDVFSQELTQQFLALPLHVAERTVYPNCAMVVTKA